MGSNIHEAAHPCQDIDQASALTLFPQITRIILAGPWESPALPRDVVGNTSTHQHGCWFSRQFLGSVFSFRTCLVLSPVLPLQFPCSGLTCFSMMAKAKLRCCSWDPPQAAGTTGQLHLQTSQPRPFPAHSTSPPTSSIPSLL